MPQLKTYSLKRKLDLPLYSLSPKRTTQKSCFIDSNRVDTVKPVIINKNKKQKKQDKLVGHDKAKP